MKTVKQVSDLTGVSVRMLHHYDKIGLLKPTKLTEAGYRLYDDEALETLQQILFFKELDLPLKEIKEIITSPNFDKTKALESHKKLIILKRDRLNGLIELINKTLKGANKMSFKEFDMTEYYDVLEEFKTEHEDKVIKMYGSVDRFNEHIEKFKAKETEIAKEAIKHYGSIKKFTEALKKNLNSDAITKAEQIDKFKKDCFYERHIELKVLYKKLTSDLSKDPSSEAIQQIAGEITDIVKRDYEAFKGELGDYYWLVMVRLYLMNFPEGLEKYDKENGGVGMAWIDERYGEGASKFIGKALKTYLGDYEPKIETLYKKLTADLSKDSTSKEVQQIVSKIADETRRQNEILKVDGGTNHFGYMADWYLTKPTFIESTDKKYGEGAAKFIGEAFKFYAEKNVEK